MASSSSSRRSTRITLTAAVASAASGESPSTSNYSLRQRGGISYEDPPNFVSPEQANINGKLGRRKSGKGAQVVIPKNARRPGRPKSIREEEKQGESDSEEDEPKLRNDKALKGGGTTSSIGVKEGTPRKSVKKKLLKDGISGTPTSSPGVVTRTTRLNQEEFEEGMEIDQTVTGTPKRSKRLESKNNSPANSPVVKKSLKIVLRRTEIDKSNTPVRTPRTPVNGKVNSSPSIHNTPVRTNDGLNKSFVRRLDDSLTEASPATPSTSVRSVRPNRKQVNYAEKYFECSSGSEFDEQTNSSDSDTENNLSDKDDYDLEEQDGQSVVNDGTPLKSKFRENAPLCLTPKVMKALQLDTDFSPRRTPKLSNLRNTPSSASFFTAERRVKFSTPKSIRKAEELRARKEATGPKKPRKGNRQGIDKNSKKSLPVAPNFSVTKELAKVPLDVEFEIPWNTEHADAIEELHSEIRKDFPRWLILLRHGFNIMLHGYGSKQVIFDSFSEFLEDYYLVAVVNGLFPKFNARKFVLGFIDSLDLEDISISPSSVYNMTEELFLKAGHLDRPPVFIFGMNFDMLAARHSSMLEAITGLVQIPFIHLVASADHVNAGLGIPSSENISLKFVWTDCTTYENYHQELTWNTNVFGNASDANSAESSIEHIFKSLTTNSKKAFGILAGLQLKKLKGKKKSEKFQGVEFRELLNLCRDSFVAHSETTLKALLTEFVDHKLLRYTGKGKNDDNALIIDLEEPALEKYSTI